MTCPRCSQPSVMGYCTGCRHRVAACECPRSIRRPEWRERDLSRDESGRLVAA
jgi:hypothetical protein